MTVAERLAKALEVRLAAAVEAPLPGGPTGVPFVEAIDWHRDRAVVSRDAFEAMDAAGRRRSFTVANLAQTDMVAQVWTGIDEALRNGTTLTDFKKKMLADLTRDWAGSVANPAARIETIFRNAEQTAFNSGRMTQAAEAIDTHPDLRFDAILDTRTTEEICRPLNGTVVAQGDPWWNGHTPPLHHQCRSTVVALTKRQSDREGGVTPGGKPVAAQDGFGAMPDPLKTKPDWVEPALTKQPDALEAVARNKEAQADTVPWPRTPATAKGLHETLRPEPELAPVLQPPSRRALDLEENFDGWAQRHKVNLRDLDFDSAAGFTTNRGMTVYQGGGVTDRTGWQTTSGSPLRGQDADGAVAVEVPRGVEVFMGTGEARTVMLPPGLLYALLDEIEDGDQRYAVDEVE